jgi:hypothetical protein
MWCRTDRARPAGPDPPSCPSRRLPSRARTRATADRKVRQKRRPVLQGDDVRRRRALDDPGLAVDRFQGFTVTLFHRAWGSNPSAFQPCAAYYTHGRRHFLVMNCARTRIYKPASRRITFRQIVRPSTNPVAVVQVRDRRVPTAGFVIAPARTQRACPAW